MTTETLDRGPRTPTVADIAASKREALDILDKHIRTGRYTAPTASEIAASKDCEETRATIVRVELRRGDSFAAAELAEQHAG